MAKLSKKPAAKKVAKKVAKKAPKKRKGGKPRFKPTPEQLKTVEAMAGYGIPHRDIALVIGVSRPTLRLRCSRELDTGHVKANARVAESLFQQAVGEAPVIQISPDGSRAVVKERVEPKVAAAIWWSKARMGYSETSKHEHTLDLSKLTDAELNAFEKLCEKIERIDSGQG